MGQEDLSSYNAPGTPLRMAQLRMLEIVMVVHEICTKHNIRYWIDYGTLLGAVRHGGFIPWDDDLDISILKSDIKKFTEAMQSHLPENYAYQDWKNERKLTFKVIKIRDKHSYYEDGIYQKGELNYDGIFIDVFPVEYVPSKQWKMAVDYYHGRAFRRIRGKKVPLHEKLISYCMYPFTSALVVFSRLVSATVKSNLFMNTYAGLNLNCAHLNTTIFPLKKISFEGQTFYAPNNPDKYLREIYGDYMTIPPASKRETHALTIQIY
jgi:lipopolysaccharide cholinephosphotransferase